MADLGRLQPFVAVTQSIAFAMPAKGSLRPETVIGRGLAQRPLPGQKADIRGNCCGAERSLRRPRRLSNPKAEEIGDLRFRRLMTRCYHPASHSVPAVLIQLSCVVNCGIGSVTDPCGLSILLIWRCYSRLLVTPTQGQPESAGNLVIQSQ